MTYKQTLEYMYSQLPIFQRQGKAAYKPDLSRTIKICELLGNPQNNFPAVHIAGTNGKGSTSHMVASILQEAGYKTGLHTSPHLKDFRERIKINGQLVPKEFVIDFVERTKKALEHIAPSFFELTVAMTFDYFAREQAEIVVLETGMGGRLDSTNVCKPVITAITNISYDHTQFLGNTLKDIAKEKAGIMKAKTPIVLGEIQPEIIHVFESKAKRLNIPLYYTEDKEYKTDLKGFYQQKNARLAAKICEVMAQNGWKVNNEHILTGLQNVVKNTELLGRWQTISTTPLIICDCGHNEEGIKAAMNELKKLDYNQLHFVLGMVGDKDVSNLLSLLPKQATYYFCQPNIPRALPKEELMQKAKGHQLIGKTYPSVSSALEKAQSVANKQDVVFVGGSTFVVAEVV